VVLKVNSDEELGLLVDSARKLGIPAEIVERGGFRVMAAVGPWWEGELN
jgi:hypothetical protein